MLNELITMMAKTKAEITSKYTDVFLHSTDKVVQLLGFLKVNLELDKMILIFVKSRISA